MGSSQVLRPAPQERVVVRAPSWAVSENVRWITVRHLIPCFCAYVQPNPFRLQSLLVRLKHEQIILVGHH